MLSTVISTMLSLSLQKSTIINGVSSMRRIEQYIFSWLLSECTAHPIYNFRLFLIILSCKKIKGKQKVYDTDNILLDFHFKLA